uniref:Abnormal cell migration protein 18-like fibronectin type I domain-containing protein n=1 Tax=Setaria digitata TaxID=48799 RepID=A0A915Q764_9BILA
MASLFRYLFWIIILHLTAAAKAESLSRERCWSSGNGQPARWFNHGEQISRGKYWYTCNYGVLQPKGCFTPSNEQLHIGDKFVENGYEMKCVLDRNGYLQFEFTACVPKSNKRYKIGETWEDEQHMYWFECKADGPYLRVEIGGCVTHDKLRRIKLDEIYEFGEYVKNYVEMIRLISSEEDKRA